MTRIFHFFKKALRYIYRETFLHGVWYFSSYFPFFPTLMLTKVRPICWRIMGAKIGKGCYIGYGIYLDVASMKRLTMGNNSAIAAECLLLLHKRDMEKFHQGDLILKTPMKEAFIKIEDNVHIGMRTIIMPGVTIGEGSIIGTGSLLTKDIPPYSIAAGTPAKRLREVQQKKGDFE